MYATHAICDMLNFTCFRPSQTLKDAYKHGGRCVYLLLLAHAPFSRAAPHLSSITRKTNTFVVPARDYIAVHVHRPCIPRARANTSQSQVSLTS